MSNTHSQFMKAVMERRALKGQQHKPLAMHKFKVGDLVRLKADLVEKIASHKSVFQTYHPRGGPREWIVNLCSLENMRIDELEYNFDDIPVISLSSDPCLQLWEESWFEFVAEENFSEQEDLFTI